MSMAVTADLAPVLLKGQRSTARTGKVVFADQLRGLAALAVVMSHVFNFYPFAQPIVSAVAAVPQVTAPVIWMSRLVTQSWINFGPFGVAVFFLVSGFVIPFSLRRYTRGAFLLARGLRIYPTYVAALAIGCLLVVASARYWGRQLPFNHRDMWANALLVHPFLQIKTIDQVNWTLVVELHFYFFAALARPWILRCSLWPMVAAVAGAGGLILAQWSGVIRHPSFLEIEAQTLPFMLIGTVFHYHFVGGLRTATLCAAVAGLAAVVAALFKLSVLTTDIPVLVDSYAYALGLFVLAYAARRWIPDLRILRALSQISFPLYAVHNLAAYTLLTWLIAGPPQWSYASAGAATMAVLLALAWALHQGVERWTIHWGTALGRSNT